MKFLKSKTFYLLALSASLLIFSFPKINQWMCIWLALVPLFFALDGKSYVRSFFLSFFCGVLFFSGTLHWFSHVTFVGAGCIVLVLSIYFGLFGLVYRAFENSKPIVRLIALPSAWVVLELIRGSGPLAFGWASLGQAVYEHLWIIQIADVTGMFGVSFLVVLVNVFFKEMMRRRIRIGQRMLIIVVTLALISSAYGYGFLKLSQRKKNPTSDFVVAVIQGNIEQELKWNVSQWQWIFEKHLELTDEVVDYKPNLIVWPETSFPGFWNEDQYLMDELSKYVASIKIPILIGTILTEDDHYYNAAILIEATGEVKQIYRKLHLVPFGEYLPARSIFPFLTDLVPIDDFLAGNDPVVFKVRDAKNVERTFSTLICFEDTLDHLGRMFAKAGAGLLINITNDAWFNDTKAPFMHLQSAVFRSVENRKGLVRAANTGLSCFIDQYGDVKKCVEDRFDKKTYVPGYAFYYVNFNLKPTFYSKFGNVFVWGCLGFLLFCLINRLKKRKN